MVCPIFWTCRIVSVAQLSLSSDSCYWGSGDPGNRHAHPAAQGRCRSEDARAHRRFSGAGRRGSGRGCKSALSMGWAVLRSEEPANIFHEELSLWRFAGKFHGRNLMSQNLYFTPDIETRPPFCVSMRCCFNTPTARRHQPFNASAA